MDCHMPEMDGFEATLAWRRAEPPGSRLPIIAMTAGVLAENRARCFTAGMDDFIAKPIDIDALGRALAAWTVADRVRRPDHDAAADQHSKPDRVKPCAVDATRLEVLRHIGPDDGWGMPPAVIEAFLAELPQPSRTQPAGTTSAHWRGQRTRFADQPRIWAPSALPRSADCWRRVPGPIRLP